MVGELAEVLMQGLKLVAEVERVEQLLESEFDSKKSLQEMKHSKEKLQVMEHAKERLQVMELAKEKAPVMKPLHV